MTHRTSRLGGVVSFQPLRDLSVGLFGLLLLDPVTAVQVDLFDVGDELCEVLGLGYASRSP
jgi:hypothetical protein